MAKPSGSNGRLTLRRLCRLVGWFVLLVLLGYGVSNLCLSSSWGTGMAEAKLKGRTGQDWQVGSMTWSPWNGLTVHDIQMLQPVELRDHLTDPVVSVDRIRVKPYWGQLVRGRAKAREVTMESPQLTVSVEMLAALASSVSPRQVEPPVAQPPEKPLPPVVEHPESDTPNKPHPDGPQKPPAKQTPQAPPAETKLPPPGLPLRIYMNGASLRVVSVSKDAELLQMDDVSMDLPVFGEDSKGSIKVGSLKAPGLADLRDIEQAIVWKRPYLEIEEQTLDVGGLKLRFLGQLGVGRNTIGRLPFLFDLAIDSQKLDKIEFLERLALHVSAEKLGGRLRLNGSLASPISWRSDMLLAGENFVVKEKHGSHDVVFDEVRLPAVFRQGQLRWSGVRLIGEDVSVLGNGQVSVHEGVLSVTRFVVSPAVAQLVNRGLVGARILDSRSAWWSDLDTPDRKIRDVVVSGSLTDPMIDLGGNNEDLPVWQILLTTFNFIREEMKEEGKDLGTFPNEELLNGKKHENH